ncbi:hypothetical protein Smp_167620 [Schistosoma mansoni]|uniref:UTRA domain-containing protein n=1 Tax=Schistosoma mansoni TaxID=6183 RepID=G4V6U5_SCHMA|nr:hypothetical protein Smp_167620 [Schistosoma mansoni]|eukprot:XP_018648728.1 hypothetical protein Smp_167620 [Schistosoma mansoni]
MLLFNKEQFYDQEPIKVGQQFITRKHCNNILSSHGAPEKAVSMSIPWIKGNTFKSLDEHLIFKLLSRDQVVYKVGQYYELTEGRQHKD